LDQDGRQPRFPGYGGVRPENICPCPAPWILIIPVDDHVAGDELVLAGTTNLVPGTVLSVFVHEPERECPPGWSSCDPPFSRQGTITVGAGTCEVNTWSFTTNLTGYKTKCVGYCPGIFAEVMTPVLSEKNETRFAKNYTRFNVTVLPDLPARVVKGQNISFWKTVPVCNPSSYLSDPLCRHPITVVRVWLFGKDMVNIVSVPVNADGSYVVTLDPATTASPDPGKYTLIFQYPLDSGFEIGPGTDPGRICNKNGDVIFDTRWVENGIISGDTALSYLTYELGRNGVTDRWSSVTVNVTRPEDLRAIQLSDRQVF
jgi:hypothetical protein